MLKKNKEELKKNYLHFIEIILIWTLLITKKGKKIIFLCSIIYDMLSVGNTVEDKNIKLKIKIVIKCHKKNYYME